MSDSKKSSSIEQMSAEREIFAIVERKLQVKLEQNPKLYISDNKYTYIQPDFYSGKELVIGEIFAHIGEPKKAQGNKIANDILKMILLEKISGKKYRKIIAVCDETELKKLKGKSVLSESIRQFGIELLCVDVSDELRLKIVKAQERQKMTNV